MTGNILKSIGISLNGLALAWCLAIGSGPVGAQSATPAGPMPSAAEPGPVTHLPSPLTLKGAPTDMLVRELEARRLEEPLQPPTGSVSVNGVPLEPILEQQVQKDGGAPPDAGDGGDPTDPFGGKENLKRVPPAQCGCDEMILGISPRAELGGLCFPAGTDLDQHPWCRADPGADPLGSGCLGPNDIPARCSLATIDPGATLAAGRNEEFFGGFGFAIRGNVTGDVRECQEGQVVQRSGSVLVRMSATGDIYSIGFRGQNQAEPREVSRIIGNRGHFLANPGENIVITTPQGRTNLGDVTPPVGLSLDPDVPGGERTILWGADGYDRPNPTRKFYNAARDQMTMYDFPHFPAVEQGGTIQGSGDNGEIDGTFTIVRYFDVFRFLFFLGTEEHGMCSCSGRFLMDYASGDPDQGPGAPDGLRLSFEKDEALSINCQVAGALEPIPDVLRRNVFPEEAR